MKALPFSLVATALVAFPSLVTAQRPVILPGEYSTAWGRGSTSALGGSSTRTQMVFAQPFAAGIPIFGVGLRPTASTSDRAAFTADVEVQMSSTAMVPGALSATFANNIGSDVVVAFPRATVNIPAMPANRPTSMFARIPFASPFFFGSNGNTNLNFELIVYSRSSGASWSTDRAFATANGRATTAGQGCGTATISSSSTTSPSYASGATITVSISGAPALVPAVLQASVNMSEAFPTIPLPFDLSTFGTASGCDLLVGLELGALPFQIDATGAASTSIVVPPNIGQVGTGWQWIYVNPASPANLPLETTANRAIWLGPEVVVPNAQYVYSLFSATATSGTEYVDSCPVVEFLVP